MNLVVFLKLKAPTKGLGDLKKKFGIIGNPIKHSLSPVLHEYWFKKYNIDADYSIIFDQAENRMHAQNAIMLYLTGN